jgi:hypothetical protein
MHQLCFDGIRILLIVLLNTTRWLLSENSRVKFFEYEPRQHSWYSGSLGAEWSGDRIPVEERSFTPVQTEHKSHPASCTMVTGSSRAKNSRNVVLTTHSHRVAIVTVVNRKQTITGYYKRRRL